MPSTPPKPNSGDRPSIRLNIGSKSGAAASSSSSSSSANKTTTTPPTQSTKRRFNPPQSTRLDLAEAYHLNLLHQKSALSFVLHRAGPTSEKATWYATGKTSLYLIEEPISQSNQTPKPNSNIPLSLALHLRGSCQVTNVQVQSIKSKDLTKLTKISCSHQHFDPLERVLLKPAASYTMDDVISTKTRKHEADSQSSRGAIGMTNAIRASSIASNMGELRITTFYQNVVPSSPEDVETVKECWKQDLYHPIVRGETVKRLVNQVEERSAARHAERIKFVSETLARPTLKQKALKVTVSFNILIGDSGHYGGIHAMLNNHTPHIYTTAGVYGDHEGPRSWIPTVDSASTKHRASHEITIKVTAAMAEGLTVTGFGEDLGAMDTILHEANPNEEELAQIKAEVGSDHVQLLQHVSSRTDNDTYEMDGPHIIPLDSNQNKKSIDSISATCIWMSSSWLPIPARALGFAIGPFRVLEDPEYLNSIAEDEEQRESDDDSDKEGNDDENDDGGMDVATANGEGIRQLYFAPIFCRKHIHTKRANMKLIPNTRFQLSPLTSRQRELLEGLDQSVLTVTSGVSHRALSLMRDILAFPAFRTVSYTQVWIPNAVHGGVTSGALHTCPEVLSNPFLGGSIMDARLLPPVGHRLSYHHGGRVLQFLQARCAIRGWIIAAIPLGGRDDVGQGYIHTLIETLMMSLYERGHGSHGEGGAKGGVFHTRRFSSSSGLNSSNLDFLPVQNIEDTDFDVVVGSVIGAVPVEDRNNDQLWRSATNGTESHTSAMDEFAVRQLLCLDAVSTLERGTDKDAFVPTPSMGWLGSHLSLSHLSSNATSSSSLGCGALELVHPVGGLPYRSLKCELLRRVVEGRAGIANFIRLVRAVFVAAHLDDQGQRELKYPPEKKSKSTTAEKEKHSSANDDEKSPADKDEPERPKPRFIVCVNELLKKKGLTHTLFTRALQNLAGRVREAQLLGTLVDVERESKDPRTNRPFVDPEGFPNSYVRGASELYLRVGVHVEPAKDTGGSGMAKGIQMQSYAEPIIPEGGISFGGPITVRVVENEGQLREFVKDINTDGSRRDWGSLFLHAKPVTLPKAQTAASGIIESGSANIKEPEKTAAAGDTASGSAVLDAAASSRGAYTESGLHRGGYQAIELIRLTNLTPLLWVRIDPMGLYGGRTSVFQPDACLAEMLFHDGDAGAQVEALRALAERPLRIQGSVKVTSVYDVDVAELPARVLGDCLRGSPALHSSLPHTPAVRAQAALAIAQWQNNKAPSTKNALRAKHWVGIHLLIQYFRERFYSNGVVMPVKFSRIVLKRNNAEAAQAAAAQDGATPNAKASGDDYHYLDSFEEGEERAAVLDEVDDIEVEEDEEYRVRSAVITAIACVRAKDGMTPSSAVQFLEMILDSVDAEMVGNLVSPDEEVILGRKRRKMKEAKEAKDRDDEPLDDVADATDGFVPTMPYISSMLVADALLALCHINVSPALITDPRTGKPVQSSANHPVTRLMETSRRWLDWELYRERIRQEIEVESLAGVSGVCYDTIAACAITALSSLAILRQSTTDPQATMKKTEPSSTSSSSSSQAADEASEAANAEKKAREEKLSEAATAEFYMSIFDSKPHRCDVTRAACAQAITCVCCAADRFESETKKPVGLLTALEFLLDRIVESDTSPGLRQTLAQLMFDACTGKICSMQRVGTVGGRNDLITSAARFLNGPLGASHGGDNGSAAVTTVNPISYPAASAVNDGARRGLRLLSRAGHPKETRVGEVVTVRIALFATKLWRTINGERPMLSDPIPGLTNGYSGVCAYDGHLRASLLGLWQWLWSRGCFAVIQVHTWKSHENTQHYKDIGADKVMKTTKEEKEASNAEEACLGEINRLVTLEVDRQQWRGEMAIKAYEYYKTAKAGNVTAPDPSALEQGIGQPLPPIQRDAAFKAGGWVASAAQQRRNLALDGGTAVTKLRIRRSGD